MTKFDHTFIQPRPTPLQLPPDAEVEQQIPQRPPSVAADVGVPFLQAVITGGTISALLAIIIWEITGYNPFRAWMILCLAATSAAWLILLGETRRLLWGIERLTGLDLNGDGARGGPKRTLQVEYKDGGQTLFIDTAWLEIDDDRLIKFAAGLMRGRGLSEAEWGKDREVFPRGINEYRRIRARLADTGLIRRVNLANNSSTFEITPAGRRIFARIAEEAPPPAHTRTHTNTPHLRARSRHGAGE